MAAQAVMVTAVGTERRNLKRDAWRRYLTASERDGLERAVTGALRTQIAAHGPILTRDISSAAKRIVGATITYVHNQDSQGADSLVGRHMALRTVRLLPTGGSVPGPEIGGRVMADYGDRVGVRLNDGRELELQKDRPGHWYLLPEDRA
jgi:hypothetical protein